MATRKSRQVLFMGGLVIAGLLLRGVGLSWQPLWWDEGYSVYFATEPLVRMVVLTANDIHPPLYYALLHGWYRFFGSADPPHLRLLSVLMGLLALPLIGWLGVRFFTPNGISAQSASRHSRRIALIAFFLLAVNPLHLYYSQEIRMYGLALTLTLWSTAAFWQLLALESAPHRLVPYTSLAWLGYILATTLSLYSLYYSAFIPIAHLLFTAWCTLRLPRTVSAKFQPLIRLLSAQIVIALLYLPWVFYAAPKLITYVGDKVAADNDSAFGPITYLGRHLVAFVAGHLPLEADQLDRLAFGVGLLLLLGVLVSVGWRWWIGGTPRKATNAGPPNEVGENINPVTLLWFLLLIPTIIGFILNQRLPFFPVGGERLLLMVLPYFLLLLTYGVVKSPQRWLGVTVLAILIGGSAIGLTSFYQTPRYAERDYRPLIRHVMQHGTDRDQVLALFPWQVGYWRAYAPEAAQIGPHPFLVGQGTLAWGEAIQDDVERLLGGGTLWFPAPLGLGSDLPKEIAGYLESRAATDAAGAEKNPAGVVNVDARWANPTTFLTGWRVMDYSDLLPVGAQMGSLTLVAGSHAPLAIASDNEIVNVGLRWQLDDPALRDRYQISIRLQDAARRVWADRDVGWDGVMAAQAGTTEWTDWIGLIVPPGLPPGTYQVTLEVSRFEGDADAKNQPESASLPLRPVAIQLADGTTAASVAIGTLTVTEPSQPQSPVRFTIESRLAQPKLIDGVAFWGSAGALSNSTFLAGTEIPLWLFLQKIQPSERDQHLYLSLLDGAGNGVAGWAAWPLPNYPLSRLPLGGLLKMPAFLQLPAAVSSGDYQLITGLLDPATGEKSEPVSLGQVHIVQRKVSEEAPPMQHHIGGPDQPFRLGTHVELLGYDLAEVGDRSNSIELQLHWHVLQTLLPPHHIFVHLRPVNAEPTHQPLAQQDDAPVALLPDGTRESAPTGSWQPNEYLTTIHELPLPDGAQFDASQGTLTLDGEKLQINVGLYVPETGVRLPVFWGEEPSGDSVVVGAGK